MLLKFVKYIAGDADFYFVTKSKEIKFWHNLLIIMSFYTCMAFFHLQVKKRYSIMY